ncbi:MAG: HD-GYP domain-containing protein [Mariprofundaceae bacterium]
MKKKIFIPDQDFPETWRCALEENGIKVLTRGDGNKLSLLRDGSNWALHLNAKRVPIHRQTSADILGQFISTLLIQEQQLSEAKSTIRQLRAEREEMAGIGTAISSALELETLLPSILNLTMDTTCSDAGSLYLIEQNDGESKLRFKISENRSVVLPDLGDLSFPVDESSLVGKCALHGKPLRVIKEKTLINRDHDERINTLFNYRAVNLLMVPLKNQRGEILGVLQLINRKKANEDRLTELKSFGSKIIPFSKDDEVVAGLLGSQAAVAIEKARLYTEINDLFESFVRASVKTIEQRDPTTAGHSDRVAHYTVSLAKAVDRGGYKQFCLTPERERMLRYAGLLHDFGKIGVREHVLVKAKKLIPDRETVIHTRVDLLKALAERDNLKKRLLTLLDHGSDGYWERDQVLAEELDLRLGHLNEALDQVLKVNQPNLMPSESSESINSLCGIRHVNHDGREFTLLDEQDIENLSISRGSLSKEERREVEAHVVHTIDFMQHIPWPDDLKDITRIAGSHHEKLDGSGYPYGLVAKEICIETRMMTICDIFDALTAVDRPYKKSASTETALDILYRETKAGKIDKDILDIFIAANIHDMAHLKTTH